MPRGKKASVSPARPVSPIGLRKVQKDDEWGGYVQCTLSEQDRHGFDLWLSENPNAVPTLLVDSLACGLKLTAVWDGKNQCFISTLTGRPDIDGLSPFTCSLSARGASLNESLDALMYKHVEVCGEDWTEWLVNGSKSARTFG